ncbi:LysR family transcriptional regulator [Microbacterium sp.]|uniref:LysR family transcriptional regulator n=1 Tax=Microbacterium sp. TaxID=51671 RepID=UPI0039E43A03
MRAVQTDWVDTFLAIAHHAGIRSAAHALHLSQSRVSAHLAALERVVGVRLVARGPRGAHLTPAGDAFLAHARLAVDELDAAVAAARDRDRSSARVGICLPVPPALLAAIEWPAGVRPSFSEISADAVDAALQSHAIDAALEPVIRRPGPSDTQQVLWEETVVTIESALPWPPADSGPVLVVASELPLLLAADYPFSGTPEPVAHVGIVLAMVAAGQATAVMSEGAAPPPSPRFTASIDDRAPRLRYGIRASVDGPEWVGAVTCRRSPVRAIPERVPQSGSGGAVFAGAPQRVAV